MKKLTGYCVVLVLVTPLGCSRQVEGRASSVESGAASVAEAPGTTGPSSSEPATTEDAPEYGAEAERSSGTAEPRSRRFLFHYGAIVKELPSGAKLRAWLPMPPSNEHQEVEQVGDLPAGAALHTEPKYGNRILYWETSAPADGELSVQVSYRVHRWEARAERQEGQPPLSNRERQLFLQANTKVPITGKPLDLLVSLPLATQPMKLARQLYDRVDEHMVYKKQGTGWGQGDAVWACASGYGNCTDFHSLFIALARARQVPARFEIGFPLPPERGKGEVAGYHCWAYFYVDDRGWVPVDISEADKHPAMKEYYFGHLTEDRVIFTTGRDIDLVPRQAGPPLNFFVYPYVEVAGQPATKGQLTLQFAYEDL